MVNWLNQQLVLELTRDMKDVVLQGHRPTTNSVPLDTGVDADKCEIGSDLFTSSAATESCSSVIPYPLDLKAKGEPGISVVKPAPSSVPLFRMSAGGGMSPRPSSCANDGNTSPRLKVQERNGDTDSSMSQCSFDTGTFLNENDEDDFSDFQGSSGAAAQEGSNDLPFSNELQGAQMAGEDVDVADKVFIAVPQIEGTNVSTDEGEGSEGFADFQGVDGFSIARGEDDFNVNDVKGTTVEDFDDTFAEFSDYQTSASETTRLESEPGKTEFEGDDDDDFGEFRMGEGQSKLTTDFRKFSDSLTYQSPDPLAWMEDSTSSTSPSTLNSADIFSRAFPEMADIPEEFSPFLLTASPLWVRLTADPLNLRTVISIPAWPSGCTAGKELLSTLDIDARNIISHQCATIAASSRTLQDRVQRLTALIPDLDFLRSRTLLFPSSSPSHIGSSR